MLPNKIQNFEMTTSGGSVDCVETNDVIGVAPVQRLPDLGLGPASQLRTGSVMDILGIYPFSNLPYLTSPSFQERSPEESEVRACDDVLV